MPLTRCETLARERTFFACILIRTSVPKGRKWLISSHLSLMESETAHIWKKLNYFVVNVFLFADDDVKRNNLELCFCKVF